MDKCWLIVNMEDTDEDVHGHIHIKPKARPSFVHTEKGKAEDKLLRLKQRQNCGEFVLFEAVAVAEAQVTGTGLFEINEIR